MTGVDEHPLEKLWCALYDLHVRHGQPSARKIATDAAAVPGFRDARGFNVVNTVLRIAKDVHHLLRHRVPIPQQRRDRASRPPTRDAVLTVVAGIDAKQRAHFDHLWQETVRWHGAQEEQAPTGGASDDELRPRMPDLSQAFQRTLRGAAAQNGAGGRVPGRYLLVLSPSDYQARQAHEARFRVELAAMIESHAARLGLTLTAPAAVEVSEDGEVAPGLFGISAALTPSDAPSAEAPLVPGYHDFQVVGVGGSSVVYRATHTRLGRVDAIKVFRDATTAHSARLRELRSFIDLAGHPYIVALFDTGHTRDGDPYLAMQYCPQGTYEDLLHQVGALAVEEVIEVGERIAHALHVAHVAGVIHCDVKPSNILRTSYGPRLSDFGIALDVGEAGNAGGAAGMTPSYASPEALTGGGLSPATDIYGLASTLWTMLAGHPPFHAPSEPAGDLEQLRRRVLSTPAPGLPRSDVPPSLAAVLATAMATDPAKRYRNALEFGAALTTARS
ncbi:FhaA domain-containing protein [Phytohabitans aurantiacus]|uniref:non-specific serine/threonine protein kinase n=1 Tax=Phytohabitans aurantiacus TaxID=3016789 RepID=A0ABQ5R185_9ACTN|nr:FhaA domain-containing protein [Phytohabitans aurantiacus]GLH99946.1 hypothetical protein Pa4123_52220 [Phytohabitans aurantiacus]